MSSSSSPEMPSTRSSLYFACQPASAGLVCLQNPHHVAQNSISTTWPLSLSSAAGDGPTASANENDGAGLSSSCFLSSASSSGRASSSSVILSALSPRLSSTV